MSPKIHKMVYDGLKCIKSKIRHHSKKPKLHDLQSCFLYPQSFLTVKVLRAYFIFGSASTKNITRTSLQCFECRLVSLLGPNNLKESCNSTVSRLELPKFTTLLISESKMLCNGNVPLVRGGFKF